MNELNRTHPDVNGASGSPTASGNRSTRQRLWGVVALLLAVGGITAAVLGARSLARHEATQSRQAFAQTSRELSSSLQLAIQHESDLVVSASAFFLGNPNASAVQFASWSRSMQARQRYPELLGWGEVVVVPAAQLRAFSATISHTHKPLQLLPPGARPSYCLVRVEQTMSVPSPAGLDYCAGATGAPIIASRDSGRSSYGVVDLGGADSLTASVPIYRGGVVPTTIRARRQAFVGWVGMGLDAPLVLDLALHGYPNTAISFRYHDGSSNAVFHSGRTPAHAQSLTVDLHNGWTVQTFGAVASSGVLHDGHALALLIGGIALSLLLSALILVLSTGRARALRLVEQRTGQLRHQALHDALTGLPNRELIGDRVDQLLARNRRARTQGAALFIDLDEFKNVNDTLGHDAGDRLLTAVTARLKGTLRDADSVGRMGGDEFVVLLDGGEVHSTPAIVAQRLLEVMREPFVLSGASMPMIVNTSIGIAVGDRDTAGELLRDADVALYQAKAMGKNQYAIFQPAMQTAISRRIDLEFSLRSAQAAGEFRLVYQPIYNLDDLTVVSVEALLRWEHPTRGTVQPDQFIPILEQSGQIREVGRWVLRTACEQMATWHARGDTLALSVNVSGIQLDSDAIVDQIREALDESGLDPGSLIIEVTETALMRDAEATALRLQAIRDIGVKIAVDDFGTGYSSLAYLQRFPVDCLKIDRAFTSAIASSPESDALIGTLVQLGKDLGLVTLAEGVETMGQVDHLRDEDVDEIQGFLLSGPLDAQALETQLLAPTRTQALSSG